MRRDPCVAIVVFGYSCGGFGGKGTEPRSTRPAAAILEHVLHSTLEDRLLTLGGMPPGASSPPAPGPAG